MTCQNLRNGMMQAGKIYQTPGKILKEDDFSTSVGDEGGFAPNLESDERALDYIVRAIEYADLLKPGRDVFIAIDAAVSDWYKNGAYTLPETENNRFAG